MTVLDRGNRRLLEQTVRRARREAEAGARQALEHIAVAYHEPRGHLSAEQRSMRNRLRVRARQLGDKRDAQGRQEIERLVEQCAYEHWHRMLFARFLAENDLLIEPSAGVPISLADCRELAVERGTPWIVLASEFAVRMLSQVFRIDDPVLELQLPPERRAELERLLEDLPLVVFTASDSLGWTYQFWQADAKEIVNASEKKVGARELAPVTQLFTDDYMVDFLLHNTLGAWWAGRVGPITSASEKEARAQVALPSRNGIPPVEWPYLRLVQDNEGRWRPASGTFDAWPAIASEIRVLDPSMGSGHFLASALPLLARLRMEQEQLPPAAAIDGVLRDNLFGLELDERCTQIAAFNLALLAWRFGGYRVLPPLNLACSGLTITASEADWVRLGRGKERVTRGMKTLHQLFSEAPTIGSLANPRALWGELFQSGFGELEELLSDAVRRESPNDSVHELAIRAQGIARAASMLTESFTLVTTNVPYLGRAKQDDRLRAFSDRYYPDARPDIAACFLKRCLAFCDRTGAVAIVTPQSWWNQPGYRRLRIGVLRSTSFLLGARLGAKAFEGVSGERVNVALSFIQATPSEPPPDFVLIDADPGKSPSEKSELLREAPTIRADSRDFRRDPDATIRVVRHDGAAYLSSYAYTVQGFATSDNGPFVRAFWELPSLGDGWTPAMTRPGESRLWAGRHNVLLWENGRGRYREHAERLKAAGRLGGWKSGAEAWGRKGILVAEMGQLPATLYTGEMFDHTAHALVPRDPHWLPAIWCFVSSPEFRIAIRGVSSKLNITNETLVKVPFDSERWKRIAAERYPEGLPSPESDDPTQWLFNGDPASSIHPLQVAVALLVGYRWPRQLGTTFTDCPATDASRLSTFADVDGIVCIPALHREEPAAARLRSVLAEAFREKGLSIGERELLQSISSSETLERWLRDEFFEQHCEIFHNAPFVWQIWDGRADGFSALVNFHRLVAPDGEGRRTLEKLTHTYLGDWISRQRASVAAKEDGAEARLAAAEDLRTQLEKILEGEPPYDIFVRWKPLHQQPIGWEPHSDDGVRVNIRPFVMARLTNARGRNACILRATPKNLKWGKDGGKEPERARDDFPWFWGWDGETTDFEGNSQFDGSRWNDLHYSRARKERARLERLSGTEFAAR